MSFPVLFCLSYRKQNKTGKLILRYKGTQTLFLTSTVSSINHPNESRKYLLKLYKFDLDNLEFQLEV